MGSWHRLILSLALAGVTEHGAAYTWPSPMFDELERLRFEHRVPGRLTRDLTPLIGVFPCDNPEVVAKRVPGNSVLAEWIRTAYHDMATADVDAGTGGLDASIAWELDRVENTGDGLNQTIGFLSGFQGPLISMADLIALGVVLAVEACSNGTVHIPYRGGRVDAPRPGPTGVPEPHEDLEAHTASFRRQGFSATEMIGLVACGHTMGGVHGVDFPEIVPVLNETVRDETVRQIPEEASLE